jgi:hypothetical protein
MRRIPKGVDPKPLPDLAHYRGHGIDRVTVWCLTPLCWRKVRLTFADLATPRKQPANAFLRHVVRKSFTAMLPAPRPSALDAGLRGPHKSHVKGVDLHYHYGSQGFDQQNSWTGGSP